MAMNKTLRIIVLITLFGFLYVLSYPVRYYYFLWRLHEWKYGNAIMYATESIEPIGPCIIPLLIKTYENTFSHPDERIVAALVLGEVDKEKAEKLFDKFLGHDNEGIVSRAIIDLGYVKSEKSFEKVVKFAYSYSIDLRRAAAIYFGSFDSEKASKMLVLLGQDENEQVRAAAMHSLALMSLRKKEASGP